jgi:HSP20 family protein
VAIRKKTRKKAKSRKQAGAAKKTAKKAAKSAKTPKSARTAKKAAPKAAAKPGSELAVKAAPAEASLEARLRERLEEMERTLDSFRRGWLRPMSFEWPKWPELPFEGRFPSIDVIDKDQEIQVHAELPGIEKDDLQVTLSDRTLTIKGESRHEEESGEGEHHRREIRSGSFSRTLTLPADVDGRKAQASYKDGMLELRLPKLRRAKKHRVEVG